MSKTKQFLGKTITLDGRTLLVVESPTKRKVTVFNTIEDAKDEFNRLTDTKKGCPRGIIKVHKAPQAKVFYNQLIIRL